MKDSVRKEESRKRGSNVAWKRAVKVILRALGRCLLDVGEEVWIGGKDVAQEKKSRR